VNSSSLCKATKAAGAGSTPSEGPLASQLCPSASAGISVQELHQSAYCKPVNTQDGISFTRKPRVSQHSFWQRKRPQQGGSSLLLTL
jgi:hypothetical protein